jgi:zinc protease
MNTKRIAVKMKSISITILLAFSVTFVACQKQGVEEAISEADQSAKPLDRSVRPEPGPAPESSFPDYQTIRTDQGLTLYVIESDRQPTVTYRLLFRSGSLFDGEKAGLAEFVADMLDKGVKGKNAFELASEIDFIGASLSTAASSDFLAISISGLSKYQGKLLEILNSVVREPIFPEEELEKLKQRTLSNLISERSEPDALVEKLRRKLVYGEGGYGSYQTEETVASITRDDLVAFHTKHFLPNNASLAIVGDVAVGTSKSLVSQHLGDWRSSTLPKAPTLVTPAVNDTSVHLLDREDSVQSTLRVVQQSVPKSNPDTPELRVIMSVLGGGFSGRLFQNLREDKGYTYGAGSYAANAAKMGAIVSYADVRNEVTADAAREIFNELNRIRDEPIPSAELEMHKKYLAGNYMLSLERPMTIAQSVQEIDVYGLAPNYYQTYVSQLMSVTPETAKELAQRYILPQDSLIVVVGKREEIEDSLAKFGELTVYNEKLEKQD